MWVMKEAVTVCSIGFHSKDSQSSQKGKTSFLNQTFFTNFPLHQTKHKIIQKVPYISIRVLNDFFPLNIIDVPEDCEEGVKDKLIQNSNMLLVHSWASQEDSLKFKKKMEKKYKIKVIMVMRDAYELERDQLRSLKDTSIAEYGLLKLPNL